MALAGCVGVLSAAAESPARSSENVATAGPRGMLAFHADPQGDSGLYLMHADGSRVRLLSPTLAGHPFSEWSPDGGRLAFLSGSHGEGTLHVVTVAGAGEHPVGSHRVRSYDWSPSGKELVYESVDGVIWTARADGKGRPRRLARGAAPDWSPDGAWIAYFAGRRNKTDVFKVAVKDRRVVRFTTHPGFDHSPQWSPGGDLVAFVSERDGNTELYVASATGGRDRRLTRDPAPDESFSWAPDGSRLVYVSYRDGADPLSIGIGNAEIRTVQIRTGRVRNLSNNSAWDGDPAWSPDGRWIAFTRRTDHGEIAVMRADGSEQQVLRGAVSSDFNDCCAAWRPAR
jgi:Tol biopolymer transport system component